MEIRADLESQTLKDLANFRRIEHASKFASKPLEIESDRRCVTVIGFEDPRRRDGELLWPQRFDEEWAKQQEKR